MNIKLTFKYKFMTTANVESLQGEHYKMFLIKLVSKFFVAFKIFCKYYPHEDYALNVFFLLELYGITFVTAVYAAAKCGK